MSTNWNLISTDALDYDTGTIGYQYDVSPNGVVTTLHGLSCVVPDNSGTALCSSYKAGNNTLRFTALIQCPPGTNNVLSFGSSINQFEIKSIVNVDNTVTFQVRQDMGSVYFPIFTTPILVNLRSSFNTWTIEVTFVDGPTGSIAFWYNGVPSGSRVYYTSGSGNLPTTYTLLNNVAAREISIFDGTGTETIPDGAALRVITDYPTSDGIVTWTPNSGINNYSRVNSPVPNGGTTYVSTAVVAFQDLYNWPALPGNTEKVYGVQTRVIAQHDVGANHVIKVPYLNGITTVLGSPMAITNTVYGFYVDNQTLSPFSGIQWTKAEVNATGIGINLFS